MQALMVVVRHVATELLAEVGNGLKGPAMNDVSFERMEERRDVRVLVRGSTARHALAQPMGGKAPPEWQPLKFAAPVAVKDDLRRWPATTERRVHDRADEPRGPRAGQPPGEDPPRTLIEDHGQIPPAPPRPRDM